MHNSALGPEGLMENIFVVPNFSQKHKLKANMHNGY